MKILQRLGQALLKLKQGLPWNGDWLFVTATPASEEYVDLAAAYESPSAVIGGFSEKASLEVSKIIYDRVKSLEVAVGDIANRTYDKAKVIFGATSFSATIILALGSTLLPPFLRSSLWLKIVGFALALLLLLHLTRSLATAAKVMTREVVVREAPGELLELSNLGNEKDAFRELGSKIMAYALQTQARGLEKLNQLISAQNSFRYALIYFFLIATLSAMVRLEEIGSERDRLEVLADRVGLVATDLQSVTSRQESLASAVSRLESAQIVSKQDARSVAEITNAELKILTALVNKLEQIEDRKSAPPKGKP